LRLAHRFFHSLLRGLFLLHCSIKQLFRVLSAHLLFLLLLFFLLIIVFVAAIVAFVFVLFVFVFLLVVFVIVAVIATAIAVVVIRFVFPLSLAQHHIISCLIIMRLQPQCLLVLFYGLVILFL